MNYIIEWVQGEEGIKMSYREVFFLFFLIIILHMYDTWVYIMGL